MEGRGQERKQRRLIVSSAKNRVDPRLSLSLIPMNQAQYPLEKITGYMKCVSVASHAGVLRGGGGGLVLQQFLDAAVTGGAQRVHLGHQQVHNLRRRSPANRGSEPHHTVVV